MQETVRSNDIGGWKENIHQVAKKHFPLVCAIQVPDIAQISNRSISTFSLIKSI